MRFFDMSLLHVTPAAQAMHATVPARAEPDKGPAALPLLGGMRGKTLSAAKVPSASLGAMRCIDRIAFFFVDRPAISSLRRLRMIDRTGGSGAL
ncbi:hypothetical protein [Rhizobium sp. FKL33]|uniref:hypothetical protein n=1 Tax=Rhizobium sp. FKL33 TaxID=2562307 RepID=UPI0010C15037|nr:hypothetical protein [Rhizobium sp. FKL33]